MKSTKIFNNGELVEEFKNDLHNTYSPKFHKPHFTPSYKNLYLNQLKTNKGLLIALGASLLLNLAVMVGCDLRVKGLKSEIAGLKSQVDTGLSMAVSYADHTTKLETELASCSAKLPKKKVSVGKVSYYSKDGCIGCSPNQKMANGQIFDENALTFAHNSIPLNTMVEVKNLDTGKTVMARCTDRGGFNKYGRVGDLSNGLYQALEAKTDLSNIQFSWN